MRHGEPQGYTFNGCRCDDCTWAMTRYNKGRKLDLTRGRPRKVSTVGFVRRVRALQAIGYTMEYQAALYGCSISGFNLKLRYSTIRIASHERMDAIYQELSAKPFVPTTFAEKKTATRLRTLARKNGWAPPFAWDDIDDPDDTPKVATGGSRYTNELLNYEIDFFRWQGYTLEQTAEILGMTKKGLEKAQSRAAA